MRWDMAKKEGDKKEFVVREVDWKQKGWLKDTKALLTLESEIIHEMDRLRQIFTYSRVIA
jgi:hypothetical protein